MPRGEQWRRHGAGRWLMGVVRIRFGARWGEGPRDAMAAARQGNSLTVLLTGRRAGAVGRGSARRRRRLVGAGGAGAGDWAAVVMQVQNRTSRTWTAERWTTRATRRPTPPRAPDGLGSAWTQRNIAVRAAPRRECRRRFVCLTLQSRTRQEERRLSAPRRRQGSWFSHVQFPCWTCINPSEGVC